MLHAGEHHAQTHIALLKVGHSGHDLLVSGVVPGLVKLNGQVRQLLGMGGVMAYHILHQGLQLFHGGMLTLGSTASAVVTAAFLVGMVVIVGMRVIVVAVADMIVIEMHNDRSFEFFFYYSAGKSVCQNIYFFTKIPREGLRNPLAGSIIVQNICSARTRTDHYRKRAFSMPEHTHEPIPDHTHDHCEEAHDHAYLHAHGIAHTHGHVHENQKAVLNRLSRAIGHLEKVKRMVDWNT